MKSIVNRSKSKQLSLGGYQRIAVSAVAVFLVAFVAAFMASSVFVPQSTTNADTLYFSVTGADYTTSVKSADNIEIDIEATPAGTVAVAHDTVNTITTNPAGYQLYFSMDQIADYDATHPGNALYLEGNTTSSMMIQPTTGTIAEPTALASNTWGFAVVGGANRQSLVPDTFANFDSIYIDSNGESSDGTSGHAIIDTNKFAATPLKSSAVKVAERSGSATAASGDDLEVYYGAKANLALDAGSYTGVVNYYVVSDTSVSTFDTISVYPTTISPNGGEKMTIVTSLHSNYAFTSSDLSVTLTNKSDGTKTGTCAVQTIDAETGNVTITCTTPALVEGNYEVEVQIPDYGKDWTADVTVASPTPTFWNITYMQEMTATLCSSVTKPVNTAKSNFDTDGSHTGDTSYIPTRTLYDWRGADGTGSQSNKVAPSSSNAISYTIRRLSDGNCWMTEDLKLPLHTASSTNTNPTAQPVEVVYNSNGEIKNIWTPEKPSNGNYTTNQAYALNGNTSYNSTFDTWYYSWYAATAGTGTEGMVTSNGDASASICPKGWRLPTNYTNNNSTSADKSYGALVNAYGISPVNHNTESEYQILEANPFNFARAGYYYSGAFQNNGSGYWWSSTAYSTSTNAYHLYFSTTYVYPQNRNAKYYGFNVRCVSV